MAIPRNAGARKTRINVKTSSIKENAAFQRKFNEVVDKHTIGLDTAAKNFTVASIEGRTAFVEAEEMRCNMKIGMTLLKGTSITYSDEKYDLVTILSDKKRRDEKKRTTTKSDAMKDLIDVPSQTDSEQSQIEDQIASTEVTTEETTEVSTEETTEETTEVSTEETTEVTTEETVDDQSYLTVSILKEKPLSSKIGGAGANSRNQAFRRAAKDFANHFILFELPNIGFFQFKINNTSMVVTGAYVYKIETPKKYGSNWYLIVGDIRMKSDAIQAIDPEYQASDMLSSHLETYERLQSMGTSTVHDDQIEPENEMFDLVDVGG
jgi:antirestriction protein